MEYDYIDLKAMGNLTNFSMILSDMDIDYDLNFTINMFSKDKRQIENHTTPSFCYVTVLSSC